MATAKTSAFWLTEEVIITAQNTPVQATIDLGAYVDVGDQQAIAIEKVDYIVQRENGGNYDGQLGNIGGEPNTTDFQLTDLSRGVNLVSAADRALVSSGTLTVGSDWNRTSAADIFPDNYGPAAAQGARIVVNDQLYFTCNTDNNFSGTGNVAVTARIQAKIVKLTRNDWMAIAIQSTAADN